MKTSLLYLPLLLIPALVFAGTVKTPNVKKQDVLNTQAVKSDPAFADDGGAGSDPVADYKAALQAYRDNKTSLTNKIAIYDADYVVSTNKISLVADAATKLALTKVMKSVDDLQAENNSLKQMIADLKKMQKAGVELK